MDNHSTTFQELGQLVQEPFNRQVLTAITAFHAFTRYAWVEDLRGGDRDITFDATVYELQQLHLADQPEEISEMPFASAQHHGGTLLGRIADVLTDICFALTLGLCRILEANGEVTLRRPFFKRLVRVFPERSEHLLGLTSQSVRGHPSTGVWGTYCF